MPVQINEVIIRAVVENSGPITSPSAATGTTTNPVEHEMETAAQVLEIIKEKNER